MDSANVQSAAARLEGLEYNSAIEDKRRDLDAKIKEIKTDAARRGFLNAGHTNRVICENWEAHCRDLIQIRVQLRKRFGQIDPALLTNEALDQIQTEMTRTIQNCNAGRKQDFEREGRAAGAITTVRENVINVDELTAFVRREVEKLKLEREIGIMTDGELRGDVLKKFYEVRSQPSMVNPRALPGIDTLEPDYNRLINICEQLGQHGLLKWVSTNSLTSVGGMGKITARGVDVVEGTARAPITVTLHDHRISVSGSANVQIGNSNTIIQGLGVELPDLTRLVAELAVHLDELNLDARQKQRAEAQIATLKTELAGEPDPAIVKQAGHTLRNITEGAIGSLLATAAQPTIWIWIHQMLGNL